MNPEPPDRTGRRIRVRGLVQGVGFRPHVWRLAQDRGLSGSVRNDGGGVEIDAWGGEALLDAFLAELCEKAPPLARIDSVSWSGLAGPAPDAAFEIAESAGGAVSTGVVPDAAVCPACLADVSDPDNRRFGYAFTNCTHCGPRLSIVRAIPYDRANTSMDAFPMCDDCRSEYEDPADRRFHAQPNACPECGPRLWLEDRTGPVACKAPLEEAARRIKAGQIVAVKGIGGFHLACDARNEKAVAELRLRKRRRVKPLALMAADLAGIRAYCRVSPEEQTALSSPAAPIVLLRMDGKHLAPSLVPGQDQLGFMLPYTPLHHQLLKETGGPLVFTSGNLSDEPQATANDDARTRLTGIADLWLMHDRDIVNRLDDSVVRVNTTGPQVLRRARGFAPAPIVLPEAFAEAAPVLAMGGELKSAFCLLKDGQAILSQHLGDLEEAATHAEYRKTLALYRQLYRHEPKVIAVDQHPDYLSSQWGEALAREIGARVVSVQHHHAHLAACLAGNHLAPGEERTLGLVLDGLGLGADGTIWGGEILLGDYRGFDRKGHFLPVALPGGTRAIREPWRNLAAHLMTAFGPAYLEQVPDGPLAAALRAKPLPVLDKMISSGLNAPLSSSAGRLFDAVAAALGVCFEIQDYEGHAGMALECLARPFIASETGYPVALSDSENAVISWEPLWHNLLSDVAAGVETGRIAARFHLGLIRGLTDMVAAIGASCGVGRVALSGGVMQNQILHEGLTRNLEKVGLEVLTHGLVPANDGGLALGQAVIAASSSGPTG
ncbi:(NiFe) hydrogenase maturation protein HypF [Stappia aggregata IAM 12614]|uniref:Carbamoyltransferase HypF n=1 Tax=Roseibium aggregatum (strain ATCC 25650 / DSM 13394 / JCM 20685 / NBRC 16684 / NCIMB 2208 / IAM 12614 / B1) TaxID=384765 RepID=A0P1B7_ROSAI|nr:carbamoyltransferase HypF [Roseibium aggregatum]EAV41302.1 (NiFe) hydrogenase maturation protein HypF [Stappia aggregata IAM 12614] [Roseibium aggregatum IAM 12614]